ncbi:MAG: NHL repeat-containing protein [Desulfomonilaceae bacterium]
MERRDFLKSLGLAGTLSLAGLYAHRTGWARNDAARSDRPQHYDQTRATGLLRPSDIAVDSRGRLFVTDSARYRVAIFDPSNAAVSSFGSPGASVGRLNYPRGVAVDEDGLIYVADSNNCRIQVFDEKGTAKRVVGSIGSSGGCLSTPQGIHLAPGNRLFIADTRNHRVQVFDNFELAAVVGELGDADDQFRLPTACRTRGDELLVLDSKHGMVKVFGLKFEYRRGFGSPGIGAGQLNMPQGMDVHPDGSIWIADTGNNRIQAFSPDGKPLTVLGKQGSEPGEFRNPTGLAWHDGSLFIVDSGNNRIQVLRENALETLVF